MLLGIGIFLRLLRFVESFWDNCLIKFLRPFQIVNVRCAIGTIDNKNLFLIRIFPIWLWDKLDICNYCWRVTSEKGIGKSHTILMAKVCFTGAFVGWSWIESLICNWQNFIKIEELAIFIADQKVSPRWWKSDKRYIFEKRGLNFREQGRSF